MSSRFQVVIELLNSSVKILVVCAILTLPLRAGQSLRLSGSQTASNNSVAAQGANSPCRLEFQMSWDSPSSGHPASANACGWDISYNTGTLQIFPTRMNPGWGCCYHMSLPGFASNWMIARIQIIPSGAGGTITWEAWDITGVQIISHAVSYTTTSGSNSNGASVGSTGSQDTSWGFFRLYNTTVPLGSREPTFADNGNLLEWKFNATLTDESGHGYTASSSAGGPANSCGSAPCYEATSGQGLVTAVIRTDPAPSWGKWQSWRAGTTVGLDGSASISMGDSGSAPTLEWQILSGPSKPIWSSHTSTRPTLTGIVFGDYQVQLTATNSSGGMATSIQDIGAVAYDDNGVVIPADPKVTAIFGPMIAFGKNPWGWEDEREISALNLRYAAYTTPDPYNSGTLANPIWDTPQTGTVDWYANGKGPSVGTSCTTLSSGISATDMTIPVTDASCLA